MQQITTTYTLRHYIYIYVYILTVQSNPTTSLNYVYWAVNSIHERYVPHYVYWGVNSMTNQYINRYNARITPFHNHHHNQNNNHNHNNNKTWFNTTTTATQDMSALQSCPMEIHLCFTLTISIRVFNKWSIGRISK